MRFLTVWGLFPLDRGAGLRCEVEEDAVDVLDLVGDALCDVLQQGEGHILDGSGHSVLGVDGTQDDGPALGALTLGHADAFEIGDSGEILPNLALKAVLREFLTQDRIGLSDSLQTITGDRAQAANAQSGAGEGLTENHVVRQTQRLADNANFILEQQLDRLDQLKLQILGQTSDVVVRLDAVTLEDIGVDGALSEELDAIELLSLLGEYIDEFLADDLTLFLGLGNIRELIEEAVNSVNIDQVRVHLVAEHLDDLLGLAFAEQSVVDVDAYELLADRLDQQRRDNGAVYAAGEREEHLFVADLRTEFLDLLVNECLSELRGGDSFHRFGSYISCHSYLPNSHRTVCMVLMSRL